VYCTAMRYGGAFGRAPGSVLLERGVALRTLTTAFRRAAEGAGGLVLLSGEAGVGKTSAVRHFAGSVHTSARVLVGLCEPLSSPRPLAPLLDVVPSMGGGVARTLARVRGGTPASELFGSVLGELAGHAQVSLLVFEDLHWADEATLDLVRYLTRRLASVHALLVVTYRDDEIGRTHPLSVLLGDLAPIAGVQRIALDRLSRSAVAELAAGRVVDVDQLHQLTGGNPFFINEVLAAAPDAIPGSVRAAVRGRLARLSDAGVAVVEALAVLSTSAPPDLVGELARDAPEGLREAIDRGLLTVTGPVVAFRHELARMTVLDAVPSFRRVLLHRSVLAALLKKELEDDQLALVVEHAVQAGDDAAVLAYAPLAGQRAAALGAHREAAAHYGRAIALADALPLAEQMRLLQAACFEYYANADLAAITDCCARLLRLQRQLGDQLAVGDSLRWLSFLRWSAGLARESLRLANEAVRVLEVMPPGPELVRAYAHLVELGFYIHDVQSARRWAGAAEAFEARGLPYDAALARLGGDADAVRAALRAFTQLGAHSTASRARARLRALGERRGTRTPWRANLDNPYGLTSRQLQVHALLAQGLTNAQIAAALVLSLNTVNHHVAAILTKLDVPNRAAAARKLPREDRD
jgi:DNA-binding CsgD family transcriptional regulator